MWFDLTDCGISEERMMSAKNTCEGSYRFIDKPIDRFSVYQHSEGLGCHCMSLHVFIGNNSVNLKYTWFNDNT